MNISINVEPSIDNLSYLWSDLCINMTFNDAIELPLASRTYEYSFRISPPFMIRAGS